MASPYDPILTKSGFKPDSISDKYVKNVVDVLKSGNKIGNPLFHFNPEPNAEKIGEVLSNKEKSSSWHSVFVDTLNVSIAKSLDIPGSTPLAPIFDVTAAFPDVDLPLPTPDKIPTWPLDLATKLKVTPLELPLKLIDVGIKIPPELPSFPIPPIPLIPKPPGYNVNLIDLNIPGLALPGFITGLIKLPFDLLLDLFVPDINLVLDLPSLPTSILDKAFGLLSKIPEISNAIPKLPNTPSIPTTPAISTIPQTPVVPTTMLASIIAWLKNIAGMISTVLVGLIVGAGNVSKTMATLSGLI